jgi:hypothetical protein
MSRLSVRRELCLIRAAQVQTDDTAGTQAKEKDPRSLSGGEKSFATICLLLALWEAIGCPLRCLGMCSCRRSLRDRRP